MADKKERFKRLATKRTNTILQKIKVLGNCSNHQMYDYTEEQINTIFSAIDKKLKEVRNKFYFPKNDTFNL